MNSVPQSSRAASPIALTELPSHQTPPQSPAPIEKSATVASRPDRNSRTSFFAAAERSNDHRATPSSLEAAEPQAEATPIVTADALRQSHEQAQQALQKVHTLFKEALADPFVLSRLSQDHVDVIRAMEEFLGTDGSHLSGVDFDAITQALATQETHGGTNAPDGKLQKLSQVISLIADAAHTHEAKAAAWAFLSMAAKNFLVWNGPRYLGKVIDHLLPNEAAKIASHVAIAFAAGIIEYGLMGKAHEEWKKTGRNLPPGLAGVQLFDMGTAALAYVSAGDKVGWQEGINLGSSVIGVLIGSGALQPGKKTENADPIFPGSLPLDANETVAHADPEAGIAIAPPRGAAARKAAAAIRRLGDTMPSEKQALNVTTLRQFQQQTGQVTQAAREGRVQLLDGYIAHLEDYQSRMTALVGDSDGEAVDKIGEVIAHLQSIKKSELDPAGGKDWLRIGFYGLLATGYAAGVITNGVAVKAYDEKALINILASTLPQMPANLIPQALPEEWGAGKTAAAIAFTPLEFGPLQAGFTYAETYQELAGEASALAGEGSALMKALPLAQADHAEQLRTLEEHALALAGKCGDKTPKLTAIINEIAEKAAALDKNLGGEDGERLIKELSASVEKLAQEGKGNPHLIPDARGYQELGRIALQFLFSRVELKQKLELKDYGALLAPTVASLFTHLYDHFKRNG